MFETLTGIVSGMSEGLVETVETTKAAQVRLRKEKDAAKKAKKKEAKEASREKILQSTVAKKLAKIGICAAATVETGKKIQHKIKVDDQSKNKADFFGVSQTAGEMAEEGLKQIFG